MHRLAFNSKVSEVSVRDADYLMDDYVTKQMILNNNKYISKVDSFVIIALRQWCNCDIKLSFQV